MEYVVSFALGFKVALGMMVFTLAMVVLLGRWITAEENLPGVLGRSLIWLLLVIGVFHLFPTVWYWLLLPSALLPLVRLDLGRQGYSAFLFSRGQAKLGEALSAAAAQPKNPILRIYLGRALLETRQIAAGLAALEQAVAAGDGDRNLVIRMAEEVKAELLKFCPKCREANLSASLVCQNCFSPLADSRILRGLLTCCRPIWRLTRRSQIHGD